MRENRTVLGFTSDRGIPCPACGGRKLKYPGGEIGQSVKVSCSCGRFYGYHRIPDHNEKKSKRRSGKARSMGDVDAITEGGGW